VPFSILTVYIEKKKIKKKCLIFADIFCGFFCYENMGAGGLVLFGLETIYLVL